MCSAIVFRLIYVPKIFDLFFRCFLSYLRWVVPHRTKSFIYKSKISDMFAIVFCPVYLSKISDKYRVSIKSVCTLRNKFIRICD